MTINPQIGVEVMQRRISDIAAQLSSETDPMRATELQGEIYGLHYGLGVCEVVGGHVPTDAGASCPYCGEPLIEIPESWPYCMCEDFQRSGEEDADRLYSIYRESY